VPPAAGAAAAFITPGRGAPMNEQDKWRELGQQLRVDSVRAAGWAALAPVSSRCVYAGVAEVSVYVAAAARGHGVGTALLSALVASSEVGGVWTLEAGILPENEASVRMHERCGFRVVGRRERLGRMDGEWRDVLLLERRSRVAG